MPDSKTDGSKIFIDRIVLNQAEALQPRWMSRAAWVNHLIIQACTQLQERENKKAAATGGKARAQV